MYEEGHDIGSHTYSHINELSATEPRLALELNMTQRIVAHVLGHSTTLFRSPYNPDSDPRTNPVPVPWWNGLALALRLTTYQG